MFYLYIIRNGELYKIGKTDNLEEEKKQLSPGILLASFKTDSSKLVLGYIHTKYNRNRLPGTEYFRLTTQEEIECIDILKNSIYTNEIKPYFTGIKLVLLFFSGWIILSVLIILLAINPLLERVS